MGVQDPGSAWWSDDFIVIPLEVVSTLAGDPMTTG